ncbi:MAG TPA: DUF192 domain-containing protein [Gemmatimonadales bacterium]|nr:DUF192 domain-containing protein [Gemmatimonadales bacterium]
MRLLRVVNTRLDQELGAKIRVADGWLGRLRGMLGRPAPKPGEGLLLTPCTSVHMYGMRYPLDVVFLDREGTVVALYPSLAPGARTSWHRNATHALELPSETVTRSGVKLGDVVAWSESPASADSPAALGVAS